MKKLMMLLVVFILAIGVLTGCGYNYFYSLDKMPTYHDVSIKFEGNDLIIYSNMISNIDLGEADTNERGSLNSEKKYDVFVQDSDYYFKEVKGNK